MFTSLQNNHSAHVRDRLQQLSWLRLSSFEQLLPKAMLHHKQYFSTSSLCIVCFIKSQNIFPPDSRLPHQYRKTLRTNTQKLAENYNSPENTVRNINHRRAFFHPHTSLDLKTREHLLLYYLALQTSHLASLYISSAPHPLPIIFNNANSIKSDIVNHREKQN